MVISPCERCGACCAFFCVSFPSSEADALSGAVIPPELTRPLNTTRHFMIGTETKTPRCVALEGKVGVRVRCGIYEARPSTCREFTLSWQNGTGNFLCDRARAAFGLQPFSQY